jgi:regulator of sirC expression with transglutaminase-like and TPR domain
MAARASRRGSRASSIADVLALPEHEIDMGRAALLLAADVRSDLDLAAEQAALDRLAADAGRQIGRGGNVREAVDELNSLLLVRRNVAYYRARSARDFDVTDVLHNRRGNCLNSSLLYLAVADRLGLAVHGVFAPGHVFLRYDDGVRQFNIEPTLAGRQLPDLHYRVTADPSREAIRAGAYLRTLSRREFIAEFLAARAGYWAESGRFDRAGADLALAMSVMSRSPQALANAGYLAEKQGRPAEAKARYREALAVDPGNAAALNNLAGLLVADPADPEYSPVAARRMIELALHNAGRMPADRLAAMFDTAARIAAAQEDWRDAVRYARRAARACPEHAAYAERANDYAKRWRLRRLPGEPDGEEL